MGPAADISAAVAASARGAQRLLAQQVQWVPPPRGTLRRGLFWVAQPRWVVAIAVAAVVVTVALWLYRRLRRR